MTTLGIACTEVESEKAAMVADGRWCRCYIAGPPGRDRFYLVVTYHRRGRQLTVSPKLLRRVLRQPA